MLIDMINVIYVEQKCPIYLDCSINNVVHYRVCAMANILKILLQNRNNVTFVTLLLHSWLSDLYLSPMVVKFIDYSNLRIFKLNSNIGEDYL